jgi:vancomycin permeability regulator SanA
MNMSITALMVIGVIIHLFKKNPLNNNKVLFLNILQICSGVFLIIVFFIIKFNLIENQTYLFNMSANKIYTGILSSASEFLQIYSLLYIWGTQIKSENLFEVRTFVRTISAILLLMVFSILFVWNTGSFSENKVDNLRFTYGCVPGAAIWHKGKPTPVFEGRILKAYELLQKNVIKKIILTGGHAPGELSESEAAAKYLKKRGVPENAIIIETKTSTTIEQMKFLKKTLASVHKQDSVLVISDEFHLSRILQITKFFRMNAICVSSDYAMSLDKNIYYRARESVALILFWLFAF